MWLEEYETLKNGQGRECCPKKKMGSKPGMRPHRDQKRLGKSPPQGLQEERSLWTLDCWSTENLVRLLGYRTEQSKSVLSLQRQRALQCIPQETEERALLSCEKQLCETLLRRKDPESQLLQEK